MPNTQRGETGETIFLSALPLIERTIGFVCTRNRLPTSERDDFESWAKLRLIENDYGVLRAYQGRSSLQTYLTVVIRRLLLDYRASKWGKWRPSAGARRAGPIAIELERLIVRDGHTAEEACELVMQRSPSDVTRHDLEQLSRQLPRRDRRQFESGDALEHLTVDSLRPDSGIESEERRLSALRVRAVLDEVCHQLDAEERLVLTMRFGDGQSIADIAAALSLDQKRLYRRVDSLLERLRRGLIAAGINLSVVRELLEHPDDHCGDSISGLLTVFRNASPGPSTERRASNGEYGS